MIEVEFIPVGDKVKTGDAILCHFTEPTTQTERVVLIDGGFSDTAEDIVSHVDKYYQASRIDLVVCTHPDDDHINGLFGVIEKIPVDELLIHRPKEHGCTSDAVKATKVEELISLAESRSVRVTTNAFSGTSFFSEAILVAGPSIDFYRDLLDDQEAHESFASKAPDVLSITGSQFRESLVPRISDPGEGDLTDNGGTTSRNNTSIVIDIQVDGHRVLLTGDAGAPALEGAADYLERTGRGGHDLPDFFDVPHHGSRHNLTTAVMDRLAGGIVGDTRGRTAFVSVGKAAEDFPRPEVANAFTRRGYSVAATRGKTIRWSRGSEDRPGWTTLTPLTWLELDE